MRPWLGTLAAPLCVLVLLAGPAFGQQQTKDQRACIAALHKSSAKLAVAQAKRSATCLKDAAKGRESAPETCVGSDPRGKVARAVSRTEATMAKRCGALPDFGYADADTVNAVASAASLDLLLSALGSDLDTVMLVGSRAAAACQLAVLKTSGKLFRTLAKTFDACAKNALKDGSASSAVGLATLCFDALASDSRGKIAKRRSKLSRAVTKKCQNLELASVLPGDCAEATDAGACLADLVDCALCQMRNGTDRLARDCDLFDDGESNASCTERSVACDDDNACTADLGHPLTDSCTSSEMALRPCASPPCAVNDSCLYLIERTDMSDEQATLIASLQGLLAQKRPGIWVTMPWLPEEYLADLVATHGVSTETVADPWDLVERFADSVNGYVLMDMTGDTDSLSVATSLSGVLGALMVDQSIQSEVAALGIPLATDARGRAEPWCLAEYAGQFATDIFVEVLEGSVYSHDPFLLRDMAVASKAFTFHQGDDPDFRTEVLETGGSHPMLLGWAGDLGGGEHSFVKTASQAGASVVAADHSKNLSVLSNVDESRLPLATTTVVPEFDPAAHYVTFVMSDGDNITWVAGDFVDEQWWGSAHRGSFPMSWGVGSTLAEFAPSVLARLGGEASSRDSFVAGPSGAGYVLPSAHSDIEGHARRSAELAAASGIALMTVVDDWSGWASVESVIPYLAEEEISGVLYTAGSYAGQVKPLWQAGKPALPNTHYLEDTDGGHAYTPAELAASINAQPADPVNDEESYSVVFVHAWSDWDIDGDGTKEGGPMDGVAATIEMFDDHVEVLTADELVELIVANYTGPKCGDSVCAETEDCEFCRLDCGTCTSWTYEAETDMSHGGCRSEGEGWACNVSDDSSTHMVYGPYVSGLPAGAMTASFHLMVGAVPPDLPGTDIVATVDVYDATGGGTLGVYDVPRSEFAEALQYQAFELAFTNPDGSNLEFRVAWHDNAYLNIDKVVIALAD